MSLVDVPSNDLEGIGKCYFVLMSFPECQLDVCLRQAAVRKAAENSGHLTARPLGTFKSGLGSHFLRPRRCLEVECGGHGG